MNKHLSLVFTKFNFFISLILALVTKEIYLIIIFVSLPPTLIFILINPIICAPSLKLVPIDKEHGGSCGLLPSIDLWLMFFVLQYA